ncbi:hypothetical protein GFS60_02064 [Rhodococcus sp. WAY2]|nr:hypothetical protein GFS60_02064 [Rhodococcus sp. WAY2]
MAGRVAGSMVERGSVPAPAARAAAAVHLERRTSQYLGW